ncbi:alkylation response protein AidB-like acyl-CoA dehydrogenase [Haloactinospora alba]|uniref:Alkylation response protein AidB-like acyl-CoA dehydrogenase n=1 Tax=Haloactinospora alba TaxID=405555 RepID=A0A543N975_9ACTN|nr:acyl-CoA dehydrogenase [Haloactinospora alba]TQN28383.1 alkylation response protein AidB-like acyl-CoA dehydrogenase [Haloactinospora alba]
MDQSIDPLQTRIADALTTVLTRTGDLDAELAAIGVPGMGAPESVGGLGLGLSADTMVNLGLGRGLEPQASYRETALVLDLLAGSEVPRSRLAALLRGEQHAATVGVHTTADLRVDDSGRAWGESEHLPAGRFGLALIRAMEQHGNSGWYLVVPQESTCETESGTRLGLSTVRLRFTGAPAEALRLSEPHTRWALDAARVRQAALLLGVADRALELARTHVNQRRQFGKPLVELQTVAHELARLIGAADGWRLLLHQTAWRCDRGRAEAAEPSRLLAAASEHALACARTSLHLHGVRGMLAHSTPAAAFRVASVEATRLDTPANLWNAAGAARGDAADS